MWLVRHARRFDVIHAEGGWTFTTLAALIVGRLSRRVVILSPHETLTDFDISRSGALGRLTKKVLRRFYLRWFDRVVTSSGLEQRDTDRSGGATDVIYHAVSIPPDRRRRRDADKRDVFVVGYLGRLDPKKNVEILVDSLPLLSNPVRLVVAGEGDPFYEQELRDRARRAGVAGQVEWLGFVGGAGKRSFFEGIHVLALPSSYECFGVAAAEAMAAGVTVIVSRNCGVAEVVERYAAGMIVEPMLCAVSGALEDAQRDPIRRVSFSRRARAAATAEFSLEIHGARLLAVYERAMTERSLDRLARRSGHRS